MFVLFVTELFSVSTCRKDQKKQTICTYNHTKSVLLLRRNIFLDILIE